ncbi:YiiX family permuted papain-like enzyme [Flavobacterium sp.]|uniref:YiiX family permuted papain-like enzyme n=1 Tax=Flavobacterium sp. TaxID=239 RepID=UPI00262B4EAC|nr:YiiX family permuted papain-like enzyme [Flavobacterium sp.]
MKFLLAIISITLFTSCKTDTNGSITSDNILLQEGDIIFQTSESEQSKAIQLATNSPYSHCGIIFKQDTSYYVYEAIQPVTKTLLKEWIKRGKDNHYVIKRLINADNVLTDEALLRMRETGKAMSGKDYDLYFEWNNDKIYCSELVWKIYKEGTGLEIGKTQQLKDFSLSNSIVQQKLKERFGENIPLNEKVISPAAIFNSSLLYTVYEN